MAKEQKTFKFEYFLSRYLSNFLRILLTNIYFAVPSIIAIGICYFLSELIFGGTQIILMLFSIVLIFPFFSGVTIVTRNIARGDEKVQVFSTFIKGIKNNFLAFLIHGLVLFIATVLSYLSISFYISLINTPDMPVKWMIWGVLIICILLALVVFYTYFYIPVMTVTYDIKKRYIYKNSILMSFGEAKNNLIATLFLLVVAAIVATIIYFSASYSVLFFIISLLLYVFILPATISYTINFFVYDGMTNLISKKDLKDKDTTKNKKIEIKLEDLDRDTIDVSKLKDTDDYIFYNGKMIKQSTLLKLLKNNDSEDDNG